MKLPHLAFTFRLKSSDGSFALFTFTPLRWWRYEKDKYTTVLPQLKKSVTTIHCAYGPLVVFLDLVEETK